MLDNLGEPRAIFGSACVEVRRSFHELRTLAIESCNEHFMDIFGGDGQVSTEGLPNTIRWALGPVLL